MLSVRSSLSQGTIYSPGESRRSRIEEDLLLFSVPVSHIIHRLIGPLALFRVLVPIYAFLAAGETGARDTR